MSEIFINIEKNIEAIDTSVSILSSFACGDDDFDLHTARHLVGLIQNDILERINRLLTATSNLRELHKKEESARKENNAMGARIKEALDRLRMAGEMTISASIESKDESVTRYFSAAAVRIGAATRILEGRDELLETRISVRADNRTEIRQ